MRYQFHDFILDTETHELYCNAQLLHGEPQVLALLSLLVEKAGTTVSKDDIYETIWPGRVVSEAALSSRIKTLRQLLGDDGKSQTYIRTVHKKGFRFVAEVMCIEVNAEFKGHDQTSEQGTTSIGDRVTKSSEDAVTHSSSTRSTNSKPFVAVLPFSNLSSDPEQEYLSDGITSDIITHLSKHHWIGVVSRNSVFGYKHKSVDLNQLGAELNVSYVVEGSVQRSAERVRISVKLIDTCTGANRWAERYDRQLTDIFDLQDEIAEMVAARLEPEIGYAERNKVVLSRPANLAAWDYYHLGVSHFFRFTSEGNIEAQVLFRKSTELDSNFGEAHCWWAYAVLLGMVYWDTEPSTVLLKQALDACNKALSLDSRNAVYYAFRGRVQLARCEYESALLDNERAIALNPTFSAAHCCLGDSLAYEGRYAEAIASFERALSLGPNDPQLWAFLSYGALAHIFSNDYETALNWARRASNIPNCQYWATAHRVVSLAYLGRVEEAARTITALKNENPKFSLEFARQKLFYLKDENQKSHYLEGLKMAGLS